MPLKAIHNLSIRFGFNDVPHFCLAIFHAALTCQLVVGMHLYGESVVGIYQFEQEREFVAEPLVVALADEVAHVDFEDFIEGVFLQEAFGDYRLVAGDCRECPEFAAVGQRAIIESECLDFVAAPDFVFVQRHEFEGIEHIGDWE